LLNGDATTFVRKVTVAVYELTNHSHGCLCALTQWLTFHEMTNEHCRENVASAMEENRYLLVVNTKILTIVKMLSEASQRLIAPASYNAVVSIYTRTGDDCRLGTKGYKAVKHVTCLLPSHAFFAVWYVGELAGFSVIRKGEVGNAKHLAH
jgi:hypothetical protein